MDTITRIDNHFRAARAAGSLARRYSEWSLRHSALGRFGLDEFIDVCRDRRAADTAARDAGIAALCLEARSGDELASTMLLWLFAAGLRAKVRTLPVFGDLTREDLEAEALAGFWEAITHVQRDSTYVAAELLNAARRRAVRAAFKEKASAERLDQHQHDGLDELAEIEAMAAVDDATAHVARDIVRDALAAGVLADLEARLLLADSKAIAMMIEAGLVNRSNYRRQRLRLYGRLRSWLRADATRNVEDRSHG